MECSNHEPYNSDKDVTVCVGCGKAIKRNQPWIAEGKTLADFANTGKVFKRLKHGLSFGFIEIDGFLKEFDMESGIVVGLARLTAEDLTATDWEEVK
jgi:hypothetical protein